jgi:hypothetical protein
VLEHVGGIQGTVQCPHAPPERHQLHNLTVGVLLSLRLDTLHDNTTQRTSQHTAQHNTQHMTQHNEAQGTTQHTAEMTLREHVHMDH